MNSKFIPIFTAIIGGVFFIISVYESYYPHDATRRITVCFGDFYMFPHHNSITIPSALISILFLSFSGWFMFKRLPNLNRKNQSHAFLVDSNDIDAAG